MSQENTLPPAKAEALDLSNIASQIDPKTSRGVRIIAAVLMVNSKRPGDTCAVASELLIDTWREMERRGM